MSIPDECTFRIFEHLYESLASLTQSTAWSRFLSFFRFCEKAKFMLRRCSRDLHFIKSLPSLCRHAGSGLTTNLDKLCLEQIHIHPTNSTVRLKVVFTAFLFVHKTYLNPHLPFFSASPADAPTPYPSIFSWTHPTPFAVFCHSLFIILYNWGQFSLPVFCKCDSP
jgi:hypothetical protein